MCFAFPQVVNRHLYYIVQVTSIYMTAHLGLISGVKALKTSRMFMNEIKQSVFVYGVFASQADTIASQ